MPHESFLDVEPVVTVALTQLFECTKIVVLKE